MEGGPIWAETNFGISEVSGHQEYGGLYTYDNALKAELGEGWRLPAKEEFDKLADDTVCTRKWDSTRKGWIFTGVGEYKVNSIFLPAAGYYWSSAPNGSNGAQCLNFSQDNVRARSNYRILGMSVRAVRGSADGFVGG